MPMDRVQIDISRIVRLDVPRYGERISGPPIRGTPVGSIRRGVISGALGAAGTMSSTARLLREILDLTELARAVPVSAIGGSGPMIRPPTPSPYITVAAGGSDQAFFIIGVVFGGGLYGSNTPELGLYSSVGGGVWTNVGASAGLQVSYIFGPPAMMGGMGWQVGVDCDIPGVGIGLSAAVLLGAVGPPYELQGFSVGIGVGISVLPVSFSFQVQNTKLIPLVAGAGRP